MLRLCRLRFDAIGAPDVRLAPLELDFTSDGEASDTLLWMRNGGGKTAILSLFFALLRPDRREFLGALTEAYGTQTRRRIADHVHAADTSHVVAEWELPGAQASLLGDAPQRLVTGMVLEWTGRTRSSDDARLKRGFYSLRSSSALARGLGFDSLPITTRKGDEVRRPGYGRYRELLQEASRGEPGMELVFTESQREWAQHLERVGLDPDLARYQLDMNRREGAAHELFRFRDDAEFVDFFLKMVVSPEAADAVAETLGSYTAELARRPDLDREWAFLDAVLEKMQALAERAEARAAAQGRLGEAWHETARLQAGLKAGSAARRQRATRMREEAEVHDERQREVRRHIDLLSSQVQAVRLRGAELAHEASRQTLARAEQAEQAADARWRAWQAAELLSELRGLEASIAVFDEQLARQRDEVAPLLAELASLGARVLRHLAAQQHDLESRDRTARAAIDGADQRRQRAAVQQRECLASKTRCEEKEAQIAEHERALAAEEAQLRQASLLERDEGAAEARARLEAEADALERARQAREARYGEIRQRRRAAEEGRLQATSDKKEREAAHQQLSERLAELRARIQALRDEPRLAELAESESFDVLALAPGFVKQLTEARAQDEGALVRLEIESFEDRRALDALDRDGLLPPSRDVERVLDRLATAGIAAAPGWRYLAESISAERRRAALERNPELAAGIVVTQPGRLHDARALLDGGPLRLDAALVIATAAAFEPDDAKAAGEPGGDAAGGRFVLAPHAALFDLDAAGDEREVRAASVASVEERRASLLGRMKASEALARRLEELLEACPPGRLEALDATLDGLAERIRGLAAELVELEQRTVDLDREQATLRDDERRDQQRAAEIPRSLERLAGFERQADAVARLQKTRPALASELAQAVKGLAEAEREDEAGRAQRDNADALVREVAVALVPIERQQQEIRKDGFLSAEALEESGRFDPAAEGEGSGTAGDEPTAGAVAREPAAAASDGPGGPSPGGQPRGEDTASLWSRYEVCRDQYKHAASNDVLRSQRDEHAAQLARVEEKLAVDRLAGHRAAAAGLLREPASAEPRWRRSQLERADEQRSHAIAHTGDVRGEERRLQAEVTRLRQELTSRETLPDALQPVDAGEARRIARRLEREVEGANEERTRAHNAAEAARNEARLRDQEAQGLEAHEGRLASALDAQADRLAAGAAERDEAAAEASPFEADLAEARRVVEHSDQALLRCGREYEQADRAARKSIEALQRVARAPAHADLASVVRDRIAMDEPEHLRDSAAQQCNEIEMRIDEIMKHIESLDEHRDLIVKAIAGIVDSALDLLQGAERSSKLPPELDAWANRQFLQIRFERPHRDDELFGRLAGLVDRIVDEGSVPRGLPLLQRAAREVVGAAGYKVTILKPDAVLRTERFSIAEMGKFSGGQQLTGAILLYCTLARLRAKSRGRSAREGGLLILDNPIGTCSNITMLTLQRRVAEAMGIQLVFTTGVNDLDALATLPNIIRLRNDQRDRRSGHLHVTADGGPGAGPDGAAERGPLGVTATRVFRREQGGA